MARKTARPNRKPSPLGPVAALEDRVVPATAFALQPGNSLAAFSTDNPAAANAPVAVAGLGAGENLVGIDFRPQNGLLYGLTADGAGAVRLYAISTQTGVATPLAAAQTFTDAGGVAVPVAGTGFGFDFNPAVDRVRVTTDAGVNFRMNPNTGLIVDGDAAAGGVNPDGAIDPAVAVVSGSAYANNSPNSIVLFPAPVTTLYTLDAASDRLLIQSNPNGGTQTAVGGVTLGGVPLDFTAVNGFDIPAGVNAAANNAAATGRAFAALTTAAGTRLYGIELSTGAATDLGPVAAGTAPAVGLAVQSEQPGTGTAGTPLVGFSTAAGPGGFLSRFTSATPADGQLSQGITGVAATETLVGFDFRPATGQLFGLGIDAAADAGTLYLIDPQTLTATLVGTTGNVAFTTDGATAVDLPDPATAGYGFDFNPAVDRIRVTTSTGLNFRLNPTNPAQVAVDGDAATTGTNPDAALNGATSKLDASAYTNSFGQPLGVGGATTLYGLDSATDSLYLQSNPNGGVTTLVGAVTVGGAALDFTAATGFDIPAAVRAAAANAAVTSGFGFAALSVGGTTSLYRIDLTTGAATNLGPIGLGTGGALSGLTAAQTPVGTVAFTAATVTADEGDGTVTLTLTRTGGTSGAFTVTVTPTAGGTAPGPVTGPVPASVTFADGQTTATLVIPIADDAVTTADGVVVLALSAPTNGAVLGAQTSTTLTVTDNDPPGTVQFSAAAFTAGEGDATATLTLTRTGGSAGAVTVTVTPTGGTATAGTDFGPVPATVTFADGQTTATLVVPILEDADDEADETVGFTLSAPTGGAGLGTQATATLTITDNDPTPPAGGTVQFSAATATVSEGAGTLNVTLTRTGLTTAVATVTVTATGGTATNGTDFTGVPATVTFAAGQSTATLVLPVLDDVAIEGDETVTLTLSAPTGGAALGTQATTAVTITDNDPVVTPPLAGVIQFSAAAATAAEGSGSLVITLTRTGGTTGAVTVTVTATGGTATSGTDFTGVPATVTFADGQASATLTLPILDDAAVEGDETTVLTLSAPTGTATLGTQTATTVTITDNDTATPPAAGTIQFAVATITVAEGGGSVTLTLTRTGGTAGAVTVNVAATGGTATSGTDFTGVPATVTFADGQSTATLVVPVLEDAFVEGSETIVLTLSAPSGGAALGTPAAATVTVTDNDPSPAVAAAPFLVGGRADGVARLLTGTGGTFALGSTVNFPGLSGVTRVAVGDLNGDGTADYVGGAGPVGVSRVVAVDGKTGATLFSLDAFEAGFTGGVFVAAGDLDGDGLAEVVVTPDQGGGPVVAVYRGTGTQLSRFFGIEDGAFRGGARAALGDVDGDGRLDLVVAAGFGGGPRVALFDGRQLLAQPLTAGTLPPKLRPDFFVFENTLRNGVFVAAGDLSGDGAAEVVVGGGPGGGPRVLALNGRDLARDGSTNAVANFFAGDTASRGGVRLAVRDADGDGRADLIAGSGDGQVPRVRVYRGTGFPAANGSEPAGVQEFSPFDDTALANGVFVG